MDSLGMRIRKQRKRLGLTQTELAERAGISVMSIRRYETMEREPTLETMRKICDALDSTLADLWPEAVQKTANEFNGTSTHTIYKTSPKTLVGKNIKRYRAKGNLTEEQLGSCCGIDSSTIRLYENGQSIPDGKALEKIAKALSTTPKILTGEESDYEFKDAPPIDPNQLELVQNLSALDEPKRNLVKYFVKFLLEQDKLDEF